MEKCPGWPLNQSYKPVNFDTAAGGTSPFLVKFGPGGPGNTNLAWTVFNLIASYNGALQAGSSITAFYQYNGFQDEDKVENRVQLAKALTATRNTVPIIGGGPMLETAGDVPLYGAPKPFYLPFPDKIILAFQGIVAATALQIRALVLEVSHDTNVSKFL